MSSLVHFVVSFPCTDNGPLAELAREHLQFIAGVDAEAGDDSGVCREAFWFLQHLAERTGLNQGSKGGMVAWGTVGNYTTIERFIATLDNFWLDLYNKRVSDFAPHDHVLVIEQGEDRHARAYEVFCMNESMPPGKRRTDWRVSETRFGWRGVI